MENDWAHVATLHPRAVGVDMTNRDGYAINQADVHELGRSIAVMGWSWAQTVQVLSLRMSRQNALPCIQILYTQQVSRVGKSLSCMSERVQYFRNASRS